MSRKTMRLAPVLFALGIFGTSICAFAQDDDRIRSQMGERRGGGSVDPFAEALDEEQTQAQQQQRDRAARRRPTPPPNFIPPPPPNMTPPSGPPPARPGQPAAPAQRQGQGGVGQNVSDEVVHSASIAQNLDPQETVGLIRIPDLGTNEALDMLEQFTGKPILRQQSLPNVKITFYSQGAMTRAQAVLAIESLLSLNGIAITPVGDTFLKAVPAATVTQQVPPIWEGSTLNAVPSQKIYSKLFQLDFLSAEEAIPLVQPLLTQGAPLAFTRNNTLLITDGLINLQRLEALMQKLDVPPPIGKEMLFFDLKNIAASEALARLESLQQGGLRNRLENTTTFDADERTNQLIVFTHPANVELVEGLVERLDKDAAPLTRTEIFYVKHAEAIEVARLIEEVITGQEQAREEQQQGATVRGRRRRVPTPTPQQQAAQGEGENLQFSAYVTLTADERANTIIASGTENDLETLENLIEGIDVLLAQVRIEVVFTEVTLIESENFGLNAFGVRYEPTGEDGTGNSEWNFGTGTGEQQSWLQFPGVGEGLYYVNPEDLNIDAVLGIAADNQRIKVLSAPTIMTTHNREASISIGQEIPIETERITDTGGTDNLAVRSAVQYRKVGIELKVKPLIGTNGIVQLEIEQAVENQVENPGDTIGGNPVFQSRTATSYVSVRDGQMVVLGGLQEVRGTEGESKVFILGDIPVIGSLFRPRGESETRTELLIFLRPVIVTDTDEAYEDAQQQLDLMEPSERVKDYLETGTFRLPEEPEPEEVEKGPMIRGGRRM